MPTAHVQGVEAIPVGGLLDDTAADICRDGLEFGIETGCRILEIGERQPAAGHEERPQGPVADGSDRSDAGKRQPRDRDRRAAIGEPLMDFGLHQVTVRDVARDRSVAGTLLANTLPLKALSGGAMLLALSTIALVSFPAAAPAIIAPEAASGEDAPPDYDLIPEHFDPENDEP